MPCAFMKVSKRLAMSLVELADVRAVELDDVDVDQRDVLAVVAHGLARGAAELLEILGKRAGGQRAVERKIRRATWPGSTDRAARGRSSPCRGSGGRRSPSTPPPPRRCRARSSRRSRDGRRASAPRRGSACALRSERSSWCHRWRSLSVSMLRRQSFASLLHFPVRRARQRIDEDDSAAAACTSRCATPRYALRSSSARRRRRRTRRRPRPRSHPRPRSPRRRRRAGCETSSASISAG